MNGWTLHGIGVESGMVATGSLEWLQTLADSTRVRLLRLLEREELSVSDLCTIVQLPQSTVSRHLKLLSADGWVANRREGTNQLYRLERFERDAGRQELWNWVRVRADSPTTMLDEQRLAQVLAERSRSEAFFSSAAEQWDRLRIDLFGQQLDAFALSAALPADARVGELGCGSAPLSYLVAPYVREVIAVDNSMAMIAAAQQRLSSLKNVNLLHAPLTEMPLGPHCLDLAWLVLVLPYLSEPVEVLREAARVLKPGSPLVIVDLLPHERDGYRYEMGHVRLGVQQQELVSWMCSAGLTMKRFHLLPPEPRAKGPALFAAVGCGP